ncbi:MAG: hypothetical protein BGO87_05185 [Flavobacteriia bacterium 40-80]|nr:MAG: hypothetical protein BGO87_05185 [Flavobacteriia bacterium 40-80]
MVYKKVNFMVKSFIFVRMMRYFFLIVIWLGCSHSAQSQSCEQVYIHGQVADTSISNAFYNMMIVNSTTGRGVFGSPDGRFSTYCRANDSITISVKGYYTLGFRVKPDENCQMTFKGIIEPRYESIQTVVIRPLKTLNEIREEREALAKRETKTVTGINVLESPITALYQAFSKKEKAKQWLADMKYKDSQRAVLKELIRLYTSYDIVNLPEDEFDHFIDFLNIDVDFLKTASEMELVTFIKDKYEHYQRLKIEGPNFRGK